MDQQPQNVIMHTDERTLIIVSLAIGVQLTFSLSDDDVERIYQQRQERKRKQKLAIALEHK